jgi:retron-type reverse transcriptase
MSLRDKTIQEAMRMIIEAIYEPTFNTIAHGSNPNENCHSTLKYIKRNFGETR